MEQKERERERGRWRIHNTLSSVRSFLFSLLLLPFFSPFFPHHSLSLSSFPFVLSFVVSNLYPVDLWCSNCRIKEEKEIVFLSRTPFAILFLDGEWRSKGERNTVGARGVSRWNFRQEEEVWENAYEKGDDDDDQSRISGLRAYVPPAIFPVCGWCVQYATKW